MRRGCLRLCRFCGFSFRRFYGSGHFACFFLLWRSMKLKILSAPDLSEPPSSEIIAMWVSYCFFKVLMSVSVCAAERCAWKSENDSSGHNPSWSATGTGLPFACSAGRGNVESHVNDMQLRMRTELQHAPLEWQSNRLPSGEINRDQHKWNQVKCITCTVVAGRYRLNKGKTKSDLKRKLRKSLKNSQAFREETLAANPKHCKWQDNSMHPRNPNRCRVEVVH